MRALILDQYSQQSFFKRWLGNVLTGLGWAFWIYLWLPLIGAIALALDTQPEHTTADSSNSILALLATLSNHAATVLFIVAAFFAWSLLQALGKHYRYTAFQKRISKNSFHTSSNEQGAYNLSSLRHTQAMVVSHDDNSGAIVQVELARTQLFRPQNKKGAYSL